VLKGLFKGKQGAVSLRKVSLGIALLTVGFQAFKAAMANPVNAIKSE